MSIDVQKITTSELTEEMIDELISARASFQVVAVVNIGSVVNAIEGRIEKRGLKCRTFTEYRKAAVAASFWGPTALAGVGAALAIGVHNLATFNPDYEIAKNLLAATVTVTYSK